MKKPAEALFAPLAYPPAQAALAVGRSLSRIKRAIKDGELMALKDGRATLILRSELERWLGNLPPWQRRPADNEGLQRYG